MLCAHIVTRPRTLGFTPRCSFIRLLCLILAFLPILLLILHPLSAILVHPSDLISSVESFLFGNSRCIFLLVLLLLLLLLLSLHLLILLLASNLVFATVLRHCFLAVVYASLNHEPNPVHTLWICSNLIPTNLHVPSYIFFSLSNALSTLRVLAGSPSACPYEPLSLYSHHSMPISAVCF